MADYQGVQIRSRDCTAEVQNIMKQRVASRRARHANQLDHKQDAIGRSVASGLMQATRQKRQVILNKHDKTEQMDFDSFFHSTKQSWM